MRVTRTRLNKIAADYHTSDQVPDKFIEDALQVHSLSWIGEQLASCRTVLELGYGEGIVTDYLVKSGKVLTTLEGSSVLVEKMKTRYGASVRCVHGLFEEYTPHERYDAVLASHVLEHVDDPVALLRRMRGWLTRGGRVVIIVPNSESIHRRLAVLMGLQPQLDSLSPRDKLVGHQRVYSLAQLVADVEAGGYRVKQTRGFFLKPLPNAMMLQFSPELIEAMNDVATTMPTEWLANLGLVGSVRVAPRNGVPGKTPARRRGA
jgi:2-polyprenyl-3-methyl-5-hydroxy-6-metoxy-1,4-benzoquinol methylase